MKDIYILDCTLRDGGYVNNWDFNNESIMSILDALLRSKVDIIECGFLNEINGKESDSSNFRSLKAVNEIVKGLNFDKNSCDFCIMINYGEFDISNLPIFNPEEDKVRGIRLAFHKKNWQEAYIESKKIIEKGYRLFVQPMVTLTFSDIEILEMITEFNKIDLYAMYIVDSFGSMFGSDFRRLHYIFENNLREGTILGYHAHNNLQLAYSNAIDFISTKDINRKIAIDSSIHGMGRGAGNLNTELFADYLNKKFNLGYEINPLLEVIDKYLETIYKEKYWGYSIAHFLSASENCHPNYASYLINKKNLTIIDIKEILSKLPPNAKQNYDANFIKELYFSFQSEKKINIHYEQFFLNGKNVLIVASGPNVKAAAETFRKFEKDPNGVIISVNHIPSNCTPDLFFFSNQKRYERFKTVLDFSRLIVTSNIHVSGEFSPLYVFDYFELVGMTTQMSDNVTVLLLNLLIKIGLKMVNIVGFDGYKIDDMNYSYNEYDRIVDREALAKNNELTVSALNEIKKKIQVTFLTESLYNI